MCIKSPKIHLFNQFPTPKYCSPHNKKLYKYKLFVKDTRKHRKGDVKIAKKKNFFKIKITILFFLLNVENKQNKLPNIP